MRRYVAGWMTVGECEEHTKQAWAALPFSNSDVDLSSGGRPDLSFVNTSFPPTTLHVVDAFSSAGDVCIPGIVRGAMSNGINTPQSTPRCKIGRSPCPAGSARLPFQRSEEVLPTRQIGNGLGEIAS